MDFTHVSDQEISDYISKITSLGYIKGSDVRYDKGNTYIIIEYSPRSKYLKLVFHIKR